MKRFTLFKRLAAGFLIILLVVTAIGVYSTLKLGQLNHIILSISSLDGETIRLANRLRDNLLTQRKFDKMFVVSKDRDFQRQFKETEKYIEKDLNDLSLLSNSPDSKKRVVDIRTYYNKYLSTAAEEVDFIISDSPYARETFEKSKEKLAEEIIHSLDDLVKTAEVSIENKIRMSGEIGSQALKVIAILTIVSVILGILIAFYNARTINRPIVSLIEGTKRIAGGNFDEYLSIPSPPEINQLADAFNHMCDRLKELDEMKADLIAHISHEFRTPLAVIREAVSLHRESSAADSTEKQRRLLVIIEEECERLITAVNKMLNMSRMDAGMMDFNMEEGSVSQIIGISLLKIKPIAERNQIRLDVNIPENLPKAFMDADKIGLVLDNLLNNALKFTPPGGEIIMGAVVKKGVAGGGFSGMKKAFITVSVSDTGCGISKENMTVVFDKFKTLHDEGTGLGLYIAKQIIIAHGGDIWVSSKEKKGSTFFFTVPVC